MSLYQIVEITENFAHAGTKATQDIACIAEGLGFERLSVRMDTTKPGILGKIKRQKGYRRDYKTILQTIPEGATILLQFPFHYPQLTREKTLRKLKKRKCRILGVVHDVEELRKFRDSEYYQKEFAAMLELADALIVHNEKMLQFFVEKGYPQHQLVNLEIFDYLQAGSAEKNELFVPCFERSITVAGNLDVAKCGYLGELHRLAEAGIKVRLFGPNYDAQQLKAENSLLRYEGVYPADEIPKMLTEGFGLVWDGTSIEGCKGASGQYLCYNNPHKLSLYLSCGLPVVTWKSAAEASFVEQKGVGLTVNSLMELPKLLSQMEALEYAAMCERAHVVSEDLKQGEYAKRAIQKGLKIIEDLV